MTVTGHFSFAPPPCLYFPSIRTALRGYTKFGTLSPAHRQSGPALGKPPKDSGLSHHAKKLAYQDSCDRNAVEGIFGTAKTAYGLALISAHLQETAVCVIGVALLLLNLSRPLRSALALFFLLPLLAFLPGLQSRAYLMFTYNNTIYHSRGKP